LNEQKLSLLFLNAVCMRRTSIWLNLVSLLARIRLL
jgi:hypothetical protein